MRTLGNIIWFILGGWWNALIFILLGVICCITIIGIPIGKSCFQYAKLMAAPYGKVIVRETFIKGKENVAIIRRAGGTIANIIWLPFGCILFVGTLLEAIACCVTIILIPIAVAIIKSAKFLLWPIGAKVVSQEEYQAILNAHYVCDAIQHTASATPVQPKPKMQPQSRVQPQQQPPVQPQPGISFCPSCGTANINAAKFCKKCGLPLT